jgi:hypothetical protein
MKELIFFKTDAVSFNESGARLLKNRQIISHGNFLKKYIFLRYLCLYVAIKQCTIFSIEWQFQ